MTIKVGRKSSNPQNDETPIITINEIDKKFQITVIKCDLKVLLHLHLEIVKGHIYMCMKFGTLSGFLKDLRQHI